MFSGKKLIIGIISLIISIANLTFADWKENAKAIKVSGGENHTLVLTQNKWPWACGYNWCYQLGTGDSSDRLTLARVHKGDMNSSSDYLEDINDIAAGWLHSLALDVNRFVWAWGNNQWGQLGDNQEEWPYSSTPIQVHGVNDVNYLGNIIAISAGRSGEHSLAVDADNFVYAWGRNQEGQCGNGESESGYGKLTPVKVHDGEMNTASGYLENIIAVSAGQRHSMAMDVNGYVWTWGDNDYGQLGINVTGDIRDTPVQVLSGQQDLGTHLKNIVAISAGWDHCMALEKLDPADPNCKGRVYTWGRNFSFCSYYSGGQLGNGTTNDSSTPVVVLAGQQDPNDPNSYLKNIIAVSAGEAHSMALDIYGNVWTWGDNCFGQLGNGTNDPCSLTPVRVVGPDLNHNGIHEPNEGYLENVVTISAGFWHGLAIDASCPEPVEGMGTIWTWGKGLYGRLGKANNINDCNIPHPIAAVFNLTQEDFRFSIQDAVGDAVNGDIIQAMPGYFYENVVFDSKNITLRSSDPNNLSVAANTIIDGGRNYAVISFYDNSVLAGFTITNAVGSGIYCYSSAPQITNCIIKGNGEDGIDCIDSNLTVSNCIIEDNGGNGIYNKNSSSAIVANNIIRNNGGYGIDYYWIWSGTTVEIKNNWIYSNDSGIYIEEVDEPTTIQNNTIVNNTIYGIRLYSYYSATPSVSNCIIWGNEVNNLYAEWDPFGDVTYSCIQGGYNGEGNINTDPCFVGADANNYHLGPNSPCIDTGDPNFTDSNETDIDGEDRIMDGDANGTDIVDMGADEFYWSPADYDRNGIVNFLDYAVLAAAWLTNNPNISLDNDNDVDMYDIGLFCDDWLSKPGQQQSDPFNMMGFGYSRDMSLRLGFTDVLYQAEQPQSELQPEPEPEVQSESELQPQYDEPSADTQVLIDFLEGVLADEQNREMIDEDGIRLMIESLKEHL